jgi:hypothetical protein
MQKAVEWLFESVTTERVREIGNEAVSSCKNEIVMMYGKAELDLVISLLRRRVR